MSSSGPPAIRPCRSGIYLQSKVARHRTLAASVRELEHGRGLLRTLIAAMPVGVIVADANGNLISTNAAALETLGSPVSGTVDRPERAYVPCLPNGSPLPPDYAPLPRAVKYGESTTGREMLIRRADGAERVVIVAAAPVRDADGKITAAVSTIQDITEHRHLEDRIAWMASFPELNPNPVTEVDAAGEVHYVNPAARRLFPDLSETGMRHPWLAGLGAVRERLSAGREPFVTLEVSVGESFFQQTLQYVPASRTYRIYGIDITTRKRAEAERERLLAENRLQREFLEQLVASASVGIAVVSGPERRYDLANPCYEGMVDSDAGALTGRTIAQVLTHPSDRAIIDLVEAAIATGRTTGTRDHEAPAADGREPTYWDISCVPLWTAGARGDSVLILAHDTTEQFLAAKRANELALALQQQRDTLDAVMDSTKTTMAYLDPQFNFLHANSAYVKGCGHSREELLGHNHFVLFPDEENKAIFERVRDTRQAITFVARPFVYVDQPERGVTYWDWSLVPVMRPGGELDGLALSLVDVTERERERIERERHLARLDRLIEMSERIMAETTVDGILQRVVESARGLTEAGLAVAGYDFRDEAFQHTAVAGTADLPAELSQVLLSAPGSTSCLSVVAEVSSAAVERRAVS